MKTTIYQQAKSNLKEFAKEVKKNNKDDKPLIRMALNDYTHSLCTDYDLSERNRNLLHNYCCTLHP